MPRNIKGNKSVKLAVLTFKGDPYNPRELIIGILAERPAISAMKLYRMGRRLGWNVSYQNVRKHLRGMIADGQVEKLPDRGYRICARWLIAVQAFCDVAQRRIYADEEVSE